MCVCLDASGLYCIKGVGDCKAYQYPQYIILIIHFIFSYSNLRYTLPSHTTPYSHYYITERYMGTPQNNPTGYHDSSVMTHVPTMSGKLMLVHGLIDENVHFRHTARLINTLIQV